VEHAVEFNELHTLIVGLVALLVGGYLTRRFGFVRRLSMPISVLGGVLVSLVILAVHAVSGTDVVFATGLRDILLLAFFTVLGLSAKLSLLRTGGSKVAILCGTTVVLLVLQNLVGVGIALLRGAHPFYGLLVGSLSFVGGPGTAIAWSAHATEMGLPLAPEIALGSATLATLAGALVAAPLTNWLIRRRELRSEVSPWEVPWSAEEDEMESPETGTPLEQQLVFVRALLLVCVAVAIGAWLNAWADAHDVLLPGFLTAMLGGVLIANLFDALGIELAIGPLEQIGFLSLQLFLVLSLMGLQLWVIGRVIGPLLLNLVVQVVVAGTMGLVVLYRLLGKDYDAAVTAGGFMGFGLASMPVAFATMEEVTATNGPSPRAFLLITLVGSFFVDLANATITKLFLMLPLFR